MCVEGELTFNKFCLHAVAVLGTNFRFGPTSEILDNIQYDGPSTVKLTAIGSQMRDFTVLFTKFAFMKTFEEFLILYSKQFLYKCLINLSCPADRYLQVPKKQRDILIATFC